MLSGAPTTGKFHFFFWIHLFFTVYLLDWVHMNLTSWDHLRGQHLRLYWKDQHWWWCSMYSKYGPQKHTPLRLVSNNLTFTHRFRLWHQVPLETWYQPVMLTYLHTYGFWFILTFYSFLQHILTSRSVYLTYFLRLTTFREVKHGGESFLAFSNYSQLNVQLLTVH